MTSNQVSREKHGSARITGVLYPLAIAFPVCGGAALALYLFFTALKIRLR